MIAEGSAAPIECFSRCVPDQYRPSVGRDSPLDLDAERLLVWRKMSTVTTKPVNPHHFCYLRAPSHYDLFDKLPSLSRRFVGPELQRTLMMSSSSGCGDVWWLLDILPLSVEYPFTGFSLRGCGGRGNGTATAVDERQKEKSLCEFVQINRQFGT